MKNISLFLILLFSLALFQCDLDLEFEPETEIKIETGDVITTIIEGCIIGQISEQPIVNCHILLTERIWSDGIDVRINSKTTKTDENGKFAFYYTSNYTYDDNIHLRFTPTDETLANYDLTKTAISGEIDGENRTINFDFLSEEVLMTFLPEGHDYFFKIELTPKE